MTSFSKSLMPVSKKRLKIDSKVGVCVRVSHRNKVGYILTGVVVGCHADRKVGVLPNFQGEMVTSAEPEWLQKNVEVDRVFELVRSRYNRCVNPGVLDCGELCDLLKHDGLDSPKEGATVRFALDEFCRAKADVVSQGYLDMVRAAVNRLCGWCPGELLLRDVSPSLMVEYDRFLHSVHKVQQSSKGCTKGLRVVPKLSEAQIGKEKAQLKAVLIWAQDNGLVQFGRSPFVKVAIPRGEGRDCALSCDMIKAVRDVVLTGTAAMARDVFMLSFYMGGMNWSDIVDVDWRSDVVSFVRNKTKGRTQSKLTTKLPVCQEARDILDRYCDAKGRFQSGFHYTNRRDEIGYIGKHLRMLKSALGLPEGFCFYSARHSFSQLALECGISDTITDYIMSHSNGRRGVISFYSGVTPKMAGLALARVRDYVEHPDRYEGEIVAMITK